MVGGLPARRAGGRICVVFGAGLAALLLLALAQAFRMSPPSPAAPVAAAGGTVETGPSVPLAAASVQATRPPVAAPPRAALATVVPSRLRRMFDHADDLYAYSRELVPEIRAGNAEAMWLMSRVVDYCASYASNPSAYAEDSRALGTLRIPASVAMAAARNRVGERCRRFTAGDGFTPALARQLRLDAARAGSLAAEAELFSAGEPISPDADYAGDLVDRVRSSRDPDAYNAIAPAMADEGFAGTTALPDGLDRLAPQFRMLVWQLAACRLGLDCGPDSALMTAYCVNGGICSRDPGQGFEDFVFDAAIPRQSAGLVRRLVDALVADIGGGQ